MMIEALNHEEFMKWSPFLDPKLVSSHIRMIYGKWHEMTQGKCLQGISICFSFWIKLWGCVSFTFFWDKSLLLFLLQCRKERSKRSSGVSLASTFPMGILSPWLLHLKGLKVEITSTGTSQACVDHQGKLPFKAFMHDRIIPVKGPKLLLV